jgi:hypothetical protein
MMRWENRISTILFCIGFLILPIFSIGQEVNREGWPIPDLRGLEPYSITIKIVDGVEKIVEKFYSKVDKNDIRINKYLLCYFFHTSKKLL